MTRPPVPYSILLPPGWARLPVDDDLDVTLDQLVDGVLAETPVGRRADVGTMLRGTVRSAVVSARENAALDLILSFATVEGLPLPVSLGTFRIEPPRADRPPAEVLLSLARPGTRAVEIDGVAAIRRTVDSTGTEEKPSFRSIHYVCHLPWSDVWLLFTASILTSDEPGFGEVLDALESLVDAIMSTVRFVREEMTV